MKPQAVIALINHIENALPVSSWRAHGVQLWPIVRGRLSFAAFDENLGAGWQRGGLRARLWRRARTLLSGLGSIVRDVFQGGSPAAPADVLVITDAVSTTRMNGRLYDVLGDPLRELATAAGCSVNTWYVTYARAEPRYTVGSLVQWRLDLSQVLRLFKPGRRDSRVSMPAYDAFLEEVRNAGLPDAAVSSVRMAGLARRVESMSLTMENWMKRSLPRIAFVNCYYSLEGFAAVLACKRLGILCVDVQHGVQGPLHVAYGAWSGVPAEGYELLPDRFWCWSESEMQTIEAWAGKPAARHAPIAGGNPWLDMWLDGQAPMVAAADRQLHALVRQDRPAVLVTLQWGMTDDVFLSPLMDLMEASLGRWTWILRLHPVMRAQAPRIRTLLASRRLSDVLVDDSSQFALPALLRRADVHLTHNSSTVLEAAAMGVASVVTSSDGAALFPQVAAGGDLRVVDSLAPGVLLPALSTMAERRRPPEHATAHTGATAMRALLAQASRATSARAGVPA
jgi:hypothetical protein